MDGPVDWWWKMSLLDVCVQAGFCQIRSHMIPEGGSFNPHDPPGSAPVTITQVTQ